MSRHARPRKKRAVRMNGIEHERTQRGQVLPEVANRQVQVRLGAEGKGEPAKDKDGGGPIDDAPLGPQLFAETVKRRRRWCRRLRFYLTPPRVRGD